VITGQYRASWDVRMSTSGGQVTAEVYTDAPQARRLEYGFVGVDSLGRHYRSRRTRTSSPPSGRPRLVSYRPWRTECCREPRPSTGHPGAGCAH
jgi:hypothetical protein